ncbi:hypothetical protein C1H70_06035, partial [Halomonas urumqiensis]
MTVVALSGQAWVRDQNGNLRALQEGDVIEPGETIVTADNAGLILLDTAGARLEVPAGTQLTLPDTETEPTEDAQEESSDSDDEDQNTAEPARPEANDAPPVDSQSGPQSSGFDVPTHDGSTFVRLERVELPLKPLAFDYGYERNDEIDWRRGGGRERESGDSTDIQSPSATVELIGAGDDGTYNQDEIGEDGTVTAVITLEDGTEVGDTLTVTDKDGNILDERELTQSDLDSGVSVEVPVSPGDTDVSVTATVTDPAGNTGSAEDQKPVDSVSPAVSVELIGAGDDGTYNQ